MIDVDVFVATWERLCRRWGRDMDPEEATDYRMYLEAQGLDTDGFLAAAGAVWATREFFPRPADFLLVSASRAWEWVQEAIEEHTPPHKSGYSLLVAGSRTRRVVAALGGLPVMKEQLQKDPIRIRREFLRAYELEIIATSEEVALSPGAPRAMLREGGT